MISERISTGVPGFDEVLLGGLIKHHSYLIVGDAGSGKTILSLQWLLQGKQIGEKGLYFTLAEPADRIEQNVSSFGWRLEGIDVVDLTIKGAEANTVSGEYHIFPPSEVEQLPVWQSIYETVQLRRPQRVVIDSMTQLRYLSADEYQFRKQLLSLVAFLNQSGCTSYLVFEPTELERETSVALAVDGIIRLRMQVSPSRVVGLRSIQVEKLRGSDFMSGYHSMRITDNGIRVFPHRIEEIGESEPGQEMLSFGNKELDELLGGGLESGTTTLISGPAGVGKSSLAIQFLARAVASNKRSILYTFEESMQSVLTRCRGIDLPVEEPLSHGALKIERINPVKLYPDEFLGMVRHAIEEQGFNIVAVDSLRGYGLAMGEFGSAVAHFHNLVSYLTRMTVTTILVNEVEFITGDLRATELGMSHLADNIILLRYAEYASRVIKVIGCLKKRMGAFQPELRSLEITSSGIRVSEQLYHLRGILTGVPELLPDGRPDR